MTGADPQMEYHHNPGSFMKTFHSKECLHYIATHSFYLKIGDDGADAVIVTVTLAERSLSFWINAIIGKTNQ